MASIKEATENPIAFARAALGPERVRGARLQEVESTKADGEDAWLITLSMLSPAEGLFSVGDSVAASILGHGKREFKSFTVRKRDGEVLSMKIRELVNA